MKLVQVDRGNVLATNSSSDAFAPRRFGQAAARLAVLLILAMITSAPAQDGNYPPKIWSGRTEVTNSTGSMVLVSELNAELALEQAAEKPGLAALSVRNLDGTVRVRGQRYFHRPTHAAILDTADTDMGSAETRLELKTWSGTERWRLNVAGWLEAGSRDEMWQDELELGRDKDWRRPYLDLNEIYLRFQGRETGLVLGKKTFQTGIAPFFSPADRYGPKDCNDPIDPRDLGIWQLQAEYYGRDIVLTATVLPVYRSSNLFSPESRWIEPALAVVAPDWQARGQSIEVSRELPAMELDSVSYSAQARATAMGWDLLVTGYYGLGPAFFIAQPSSPSTNAASPATVSVVERTTRAGTMSAGVSTTIGESEFHVEAAYTHAYDAAGENCLNYVAGVTWQFNGLAAAVSVDRITLSLDYAGRHVVSALSAPAAIDLGRLRFGQNDVMARLNVAVTDDLRLNMTTVIELDDDGRYMKLEGSYEIRAGFTMIVTLDEFAGPVNSMLGHASSSDQISAAIEYRF